ncbi:transglycosylase domain-containing protein [Candidatus Woesearchaeota archaeon]|nr:transglycosylase domain-containing protein [Candidatus Woesearchaeota archaeon]
MNIKQSASTAGKKLYTGAKRTAIAATAATVIGLPLEIEFGWMEYLASHSAIAIANTTAYFFGESPERPTITPSEIEKRIDARFDGIKENRDIIIHAADGTIIGEEYNLTKIILDAPSHVKWAFVAAEDRRFYDHYGWDPGSTAIAVAQNLIGKMRGTPVSRGASTITIQVADRVYPNQIYGGKNEMDSGAIPGFMKISWKADEWLSAAVLEEYKSKDQILVDYMNLMDFGYSGREGTSIKGIYSAAKYYFGKEPTELDYLESAFLAGIVQNPPRGQQAYNAFLKGDTDASSVQWATDRTEYVLSKLYELNFGRDDVVIPDREYTKALERLAHHDFDFKRNESKRIDPTVFGFTREVFTRAEGFMREATPLLPQDATVHFYTGIDLAVQTYAQEQMDKQCAALNKTLIGKDGKTKKGYENNPFNGTAVVLDTKTHDVLAMIDGCTTYKKDANGDSLLVDGKPIPELNWINRATEVFWDPGSSIKPIWDMIAFKHGISATDFTLKDEQRVYIVDGKRYTPGNFGGKHSGEKLNVTEATVDSVNSFFIELGFQLFNMLGERQLVKEFQSFGYDITDYQISYGIGAFQASATDIAGSYTVLETKGVATHYKYGLSDDINTQYIKKIGIDYTVDGQDKTLSLVPKGIDDVVTSKDVVDKTDTILDQVVERGTGQRAKRVDIDIHGKTGTAHSNVIFVGYAPQDDLLAVVMFGLEKPGKELPPTYQGGIHAAPVAANILEYTKKERGVQNGN